MDPFVRDLMSLPPLPPADELALARRARAGDVAARAELITSGLRSVALRGRMLGLHGEELRDAVQRGAIGLIRAVDHFDPERGVRLSTYSWRWIGAEMVHRELPEVLRSAPELTTMDVVSDGCDLLDDLPEAQAHVVRLRFGLGPQGTPPQTREAVGHRLGLTVSQVRTIEGKAMRQLRRGLAKVGDRAPHQ